MINLIKNGLEKGEIDQGLLNKLAHHKGLPTDENNYVKGPNTGWILKKLSNASAGIIKRAKDTWPKYSVDDQRNFTRSRKLVSLSEYELFLKEIIVPTPSPELRQTIDSNFKREPESAYTPEKSNHSSSSQKIRNQIPQKAQLSQISMSSLYGSPEGFKLIQSAKERMDRSFIQQKTRQEELLKARRDKVDSSHPDQQAEGKEG